MSVSVQPRGDKFQLRVVHKLLPRPFFHTFAARDEARAYGRQLHDLLDAGIVPTELITPAPRDKDDLVLVAVVRAYLNEAQGLTDSDSALLTTVVDLREIDGIRVSGVTARWAAAYVSGLKKRGLAPGTIRKRVGALGRVLDWHLRRDHGAGEGVGVVLNPLRVMPDGYSVYTDADVQSAGLEKAPADEHRDRRLGPGEEDRIRRALAGEKREDRERALTPDPALQLLFGLIIDTGLRLSEAFRLRADQVDLQKRIVRVEGSKGRRGASKPRIVPLKPSLAELLAPWCRDRVGLVFPFWDGTSADRRRAGHRLSQRFRVLFDYAQVPNFTEHDLRHEATCRWFELRMPGGGWVFSEIEICRIMGWSSPAMALRYASLRGEDLSARLAGVA